MGLGRFMGLFVVIPASVLFTISFFVLVVIRKSAAKELQALGLAVVGALWLSVALLLAAGANILITGQYPFNRTMHMMSRAYATGWCMKMQGGMQGNVCPMMKNKGQMPPEMKPAGMPCDKK
jgi:hypothetical protein